jgi:hypothetical protein
VIREGGRGELEDDSLSRNGDVVWHLIDDIELFNGELINLVEDIDGRNVSSVALSVMGKHRRER